MGDEPTGPRDGVAIRLRGGSAIATLEHDALEESPIDREDLDDEDVEVRATVEWSDEEGGFVLRPKRFRWRAEPITVNGVASDGGKRPD